jgi:predicted phage tail protein
MTENYLQIMIESLEKKLLILDNISQLDDRQIEIAMAGQSMDMQAYNESMNEKSKLIDELNKLDEGFTSTYELVKDEVKGNSAKYYDKIIRMQELIQDAIDKGVTIEAKEKRSKAAMESAIAYKRRQLHTKRMSASVAARYYKATSKINNIDPQLMDKKK